MDEKANILYGLLGGRTLRIFPVPDSDRWLAPGERSQNMTATDSARTVELFGRLVRASVSRDTTEIGRALDAVRRYQTEFRPGCTPAESRPNCFTTASPRSVGPCGVT